MNNKELSVLMEIKERKVNPSKESEEIARRNGWVNLYPLSHEHFLASRYTQFVPTQKANRLIEFRESMELFRNARQETYAASNVLMSPKTMTFIMESITEEEWFNVLLSKHKEPTRFFGFSVYRSNDIADNTFIFF